MTNNFLFKLKNEIKNYAWGSQDAFKTLFHYKNDTNIPQAELWMGTHSAGVSKIQNEKDTEYPLDELISSNPEYYLGDRVAKYHSGLPFLFKALAADKPLSIQVHPNKHQAELGFLKENRQNIALNAPNRNYKDANHKPELVYALTPFEALNGFRPINEILHYFSLFSIPSLQKEIKQLSHQPTAEQLKLFFKSLLTLSGDQKRAVIQELLSATDMHADPIASLIQRLAKEYPEDTGIFMPMILNVVELRPGQAMYLDAMTPHAYLRGVALEIMASSDNVLRAGLTPKHIDVNELLLNTKFETKSQTTLLTQPVQKENQVFFPVPIEDFKFSIIQSDSASRQQTIMGPEILFCLSGNITIKTGEEHCTLMPGDSLFVAAAAKHYCYSGKGQLARAFI